MTTPEQNEFQQLLAIAQAGDAEAMYDVGNAYHEGRVVDKDPQKYFKWIEKAAKAEVPKAMLRLGGLYFFGYGVKEDLQKSFQWIEKAAKAGIPQGMAFLGIAYRNGIGVDKDASQAQYWAERATEARSREKEHVRSLTHDTAELEQETAYPSATNIEDSEPINVTPIMSPEKDHHRRIFIVYGRNIGMKEKTARFLERLKFDVVLMDEDAHKGQTLIEKLEDLGTNVGFAVVLLTADDIGGLKDEPTESYKLRARQNVIFEWGYFIAKIGRNRVCFFYEEGVDYPSDIHGVVYCKIDGGDGWKYKLVGELKAAGYAVDANLIY